MERTERTTAEYVPRDFSEDYEKEPIIERTRESTCFRYWTKFLYFIGWKRIGPLYEPLLLNNIRENDHDDK